jgi:signal recognition particle GTPase
MVVLMVGINGAGKTTTIGKLARRFKDEGNSVMLAAGDTFRAAAVEQLQAWGERNGVPVIAQATGADSASVIYDALEAATAAGRRADRRHRRAVAHQDQPDGRACQDHPGDEARSTRMPRTR